MLNKTILIKIIETEMPFGKYKGLKIYQIPVSYLEWMRNNSGFPKSQLGMLLETMYVIKLNGLEFLLKPLLQPNKKSTE